MNKQTTGKWRMLNCIYSSALYSLYFIQFSFNPSFLKVTLRLVVRYWSGYLSAARCKWFAYGPADATATHHLLLQ